MKLKATIKILLTTSAILLLSACKKDLITSSVGGESILHDASKLESVKKQFASGNYQEKLIEKVRDTLSVVWHPNWAGSSEKRYGDSVTCLYIPLDGEARNTITKKSLGQVNTINVEKYLMYVIKNDSSYFSAASYLHKSSTTNGKNGKPKVTGKQYLNHSKSLNTFTGRLTLTNLESGKVSIALYTNGARYAPSGPKLQINTNGVKPSAWEEQNCRYYVTCTWITEQNPSCSNTYYTSTDGNEWCYEPESTIGGCYYYWDLISSFIEKQCDMFWVPDPPDNGGGGGGGGDGSGDDGEDTPTSNTDLVRTDSLRAKYPCATKLILDSLMALPGYNDFVQPFIGSQIANLNWDSDSNMPWHVANSAGGFTYQLGKTEVTGHQLSAQISLNSNMLQNSSQLFVAATSIHETLHAYLNYNIQTAYYNNQDSTVTLGSWLYGLDSWYSVQGLPTNYRDHYEMLDDYFDKAVDILATWDHHSDASLKTYRMAMLYGLDNANIPVTPQNQARITLLNNEYQSLMSKYNITPADLNTYYTSQLNTPVGNRLPTSGCN